VQPVVIGNKAVPNFLAVLLVSLILERRLALIP